MERLTERLPDLEGELDEIAFKNQKAPEGLYNLRDIVNSSGDELVYEIATRLAHYEDLDDRGLVCDFPACVGDTVYLVYGYAGNPQMHEGKITRIESCNKNKWKAQAYLKNYGGITIYSDNFGRSVFKPDEAQKAYNLIKNSPCDSAEIQKFGSDLGYMCEFTNERVECKQCELCIHRWRNNE